MSREFRFTIHGEPRPKLRARIVGGRGFDPQKNKDAKERYQMSWLAARRDYKNTEPLKGPLYAICTSYMPKSKTNKKQLPTQKPDCDNLEKMLFDSLNGLLYDDDCQIILPVCPKVWADVGEERIEVIIGELEGVDRAHLMAHINLTVCGVLSAMD